MIKIKENATKAIDELINRYKRLAVCQDDINKAAEMICHCYHNGGKLLLCGNGGSAADAEHIVGELMKGFILPRKIDEVTAKKFAETCSDDAAYLTANLQMALPAVSLVNATALNTAFANDQVADLVFAQQVLGLGKAGDVLVAISTSGNSANVLYAAKVAKALGMDVIALTGKGGGKLGAIAHANICVPENDTYAIQEMHLPIYHALCIAVEREFFGE